MKQSLIVAFKKLITMEVERISWFCNQDHGNWTSRACLTKHSYHTNLHTKILNSQNLHNSWSCAIIRNALHVLYDCSELNNLHQTSALVFLWNERIMKLALDSLNAQRNTEECNMMLLPAQVLSSSVTPKPRLHKEHSVLLFSEL